MRIYNLRIRSIGPDGEAVSGWYVADGYSLPDAISDALMHYDGLRGSYMGLEAHEIVGRCMHIHELDGKPFETRRVE